MNDPIQGVKPMNPLARRPMAMAALCVLAVLATGGALAAARLPIIAPDE